MKQALVVLAVLFLAAPAPAAFSEALKMSVGKAEVAGSVGFTLGDGEATLQVEVALEPMSASEKAAALSAAVTAQDPSGTWRAEASGTALVFQHSVDGVFQDLNSITGISDTTGAGTRLASSGSAMFQLDLAVDAVASGLDSAGNPAFMTVSLTDTLAWTHAVLAGETAQQIIDQFSAFLLDEGGVGVQVSRTSAAGIGIQLDYDTSSLNWQITDTGLTPYAKGGGMDAGVIDR